MKAGIKRNPFLKIKVLMFKLFYKYERPDLVSMKTKENFFLEVKILMFKLLYEYERSNFISMFLSSLVSAFIHCLFILQKKKKKYKLFVKIVDK